MPELPEVEVAARNLRRWGEGRRVRAAGCSEPRILDAVVHVGDKVRTEPVDPAALGALVGTRLGGVERLGKNLLLAFKRGRKPAVGVWSHLGMTGKWLRRAPADPPPRFSRVRLDLEGGVTLHYVDMRLFGFFRLVPDAGFAALPALAALPPDPLAGGIDTARLTARFARIGKPVKVALLDQTLVPGVGNIQDSEALWRAAIDPRRRASSLTPAEVRRLARAVIASFRHTLRAFAADGADGGGADIEYVEEPGTRNPFRVYDRAGIRCPRCHVGTITRIVQAARSTYFCPRCQK